MADTKTTALTANTAPVLTDIMYLVDDPGGSALSQKITLQNLRRQLFPYSVCGGRLTLTTATPVTTADVTGATTLYWTPYSAAFGCGQVGLYDGSAGWDVLDFTELSLSLAGYTASKPYDIFVYNNSGTAALESLVWTDATTRATALTTQNGVYVKTGATTRRYLGTIYVNSSGGQTDDSVLKRNVFNYYNRKQRLFYLTESTNHTYATATWRPWNNDSAIRFEYMCGVAEDALNLTISQAQLYTSATGIIGYLAFGLDVTNNVFAESPQAKTNSQNVNIKYASQAPVMPSLGFHYLSLNEYASAATVTFSILYIGGTILA